MSDDKTAGQQIVEMLETNASAKANMILAAILVGTFENDPEMEKHLAGSHTGLTGFLYKADFDFYDALMVYGKTAALVYNDILFGNHKQAALNALAMAGALQGFNERIDEARKKAGLSPIVVNTEPISTIERAKKVFVKPTDQKPEGYDLGRIFGVKVNPPK